MARIRSVHPGLLTDEAFMTLTVEHPLAVPLYIGLLMEADDNGVFEWKPLTIKARVLPATAGGILELLAALVENRFITQFEFEGRAYGAIRNFCKFQRPKKPHAVHPLPADMSLYVGSGSEPVPHHPETSGENPPQMEDGGGSREEGKIVRLNNPPKSPLPAKPAAFPRDGSIEFTPWAAITRKHAPSRDVDMVASAFRSWWGSTDPPIDPTRSDIERVYAGFCKTYHSKRARA